MAAHQAPLVITNADFRVTPTCIHTSPSWVISALTLLDPQTPICENSHTHTHCALDTPGHLASVLSCGHLPILKRFNFCFKMHFYPSNNEIQGKMTTCWAYPYIHGHETMDWFRIRKGVCQGCILSHCLFNLYAEHIMRNAGLDEAQGGIKFSGRNINNLKYADDTTLYGKRKY